MGKDKAFLVSSAGKYWYEVIRERILTAIPSVPVSLSVRTEQLALIRGEAHSSAIADNESLSIHGPLRGILSVHGCFPLEDLLVLPCDMQMITSERMRQIYEEAKDMPKKRDGIVFHGARIQPFPGIYSAAFLDHVAKSAASGDPFSSVTRWIQKGDFDYIQLDEKEEIDFANLNSPEDLQSFQVETIDGGQRFFREGSR